jgi:hypothetical protein
LLLGFVFAGVHRERCSEGGGAVIRRAFATATLLALSALAPVGEDHCPVDAGRRIRPVKRGVVLDVCGRAGRCIPELLKQTEETLA